MDLSKFFCFIWNFQGSQYLLFSKLW